MSSERIADAIASAMIFIDRRGDFTTNGSGPVARGRDDKAVSINPMAPCYSAGWFLAWVRHPRTTTLSFPVERML
jgi:hypothetical protein